MLDLAPEFERLAKKRQAKGRHVGATQGGRGQEETFPVWRSERKGRSGEVRERLAKLGKVGGTTISRAQRGRQYPRVLRWDDRR